MKKILLITALICWSVATAQQEPPPLYLEYDAAGNQVLSDLICVNCPGAAGKHSLNNVTYYPNPVAQALTLTWENTDKTYVTTVKVYALNGKQLTSQDNLNAQTELKLNFSNKTAGIYIIEVVSSDNQKKSVKVIKK